jgi:Transposase DDE domain group 1
VPRRRDSLKTTESNQQSFEFHPLNQRQVVGRFGGGAITTDAGGLLLPGLEKRTRIIERFAGCFRAHRAAGQVEYTARELVAQ